MIGLSQWRAAIGVWACRFCRSSKGQHLNSHRIASHHDPHISVSFSEGVSLSHWPDWPAVSLVDAAITCSCFLVVFLLIQLILLLSGDVELNPGPITIEQGKYCSPLMMC